MRDLRCSRIALCIAARGSVAVAGMMPAQEEADGSFHECSRESRGRARPRERGNHRRCGLSTAADRSPAPGGGRLRWPAPGGRKVIRIGPGLGTAPEVEAGTISASALSHRSRAVPVLGAHGSRAPRRPARRRIGCGTWRTNAVTRASLFATAVSSSAPGRASAPRFVQPRLARLLLSTILANVGTPFAADQRAGISRLLLIRLFQLAAVSAFRRSVVSPMVPLSPGFALQEQSGGAALNGRRPNALAHRW